MENNFRKINMERIIDYKMIASLSDDMKKLIVDVAIEAYLDGLSDGVSVESGVVSDNSAKFISEMTSEIGFKL
jgi:hypothetical protein